MFVNLDKSQVLEVRARHAVALKQSESAESLRKSRIWDRGAAKATPPRMSAVWATKEADVHSDFAEGGEIYGEGAASSSSDIGRTPGIVPGEASSTPALLAGCRAACTWKVIF